MSTDLEYEEEEFLVFANFKKEISPQEISTNSIKIIGIETKNPIAEINGHIFKGKYDIAMGTNVFFEKDNEAPKVDPVFDEPCKHKYKYVTKTTKVLDFQHIYLEKKPQEQSDEELRVDEKPEENCTEDLRINISYEEALQLFPSNKQKNEEN